VFELEMYKPTPLEAAIVNFYRKNHINSPEDIDLEMFAYEQNIWIHYADRPSDSFEFKQGYSIVIDNRLPWEQQRVELAHELGHCLLHAGRQELMQYDFRVMQEWQADRFAAYALAPTFMIGNCWIEASSREQMVSQLAYYFNVTEPFMDVRLNMLQQRLQTLAAEAQLAAAIVEDRASYDYSYRNLFNSTIEYLVKDGRIVGRRRRAEL
jgi:Zn-dependent peptidase ImmA (M78 family)